MTKCGMIYLGGNALFELATQLDLRIQRDLRQPSLTMPRRRGNQESGGQITSSGQNALEEIFVDPVDGAGLNESLWVGAASLLRLVSCSVTTTGKGTGQHAGAASAGANDETTPHRAESSDAIRISRAEKRPPFHPLKFACSRNRSRKSATCSLGAVGAGGRNSD